MTFPLHLKTISKLSIAFAVSLMLTACAQGTGADAVPPTTGPTFTPAPYIPAEAEATLPSFGWTGGAGGASLAVPADCAAEAVSSTEVELTWAALDDPAGLLGFRIYQGGESLEEEIADPAAVSVVITGLDPGVQYHFDVRTYNDSSESKPDACAVDVTTLQ